MNEELKLQALTISQLASLIKASWVKPYFGAVPYLDAMLTMHGVDPKKQKYILDSGESIVMYFLANAQTWRGETARAVKKELNRRLK